MTLAVLAAAGCAAIEAGWENAAYRECNRIPNTEDRRACRARVDAALQEQAAERARLEHDIP